MNRLADILKKRYEFLLVLLILATNFVLRLAFLHEPFERDEGGYAYIGQEILRGAIPYRDVYDIKPPGVYYLYAVGMKVFGETVASIRVFTALYALLTVGTVFAIARKMGGPRAGLFAALLYGIFSTGPVLQGSSSNTEVFLVLPLGLSILFFLRAEERRARTDLFLSGFFCGVAMMIKTVALPYAVLLTVMALARKGAAGSWREWVVDMLCLAAGPALVAVPVLTYFAAHGALDDFVYWNVTFNMQYSKFPVFGPPLPAVTRMLLPEFGPMVLAALPTLLWIAFRERTRSTLFVALSLLAILIGALLPGKNFPHYFIPVVLPLAILAGFGLAKLTAAKRWIRYAGLAIFLVACSISVSIRYPFYLAYSPDEVSLRKYGPVFVESVEMAQYIRERTGPAEYIFQWGFEHELYFLTGRRCPGPYINSSLILMTKDPDASMRHMIEGIERHKPRYILFFQDEWGYMPGAMEVVELLRRDYILEARIHTAGIFRRRA